MPIPWRAREPEDLPAPALDFSVSGLEPSFEGSRLRATHASRASEKGVMRSSPLGDLVRLLPVFLLAGACGGDARRASAGEAGAGGQGVAADEAGAGGGDEYGSGSGGVAAGRYGSTAEWGAAGDAGALGETTTSGGTNGGSGGTTPPPIGGEGGTPEREDSGGSGNIGNSGAGGMLSVQECEPATELPILGNYREPNGNELWIRDSGHAVTVTRVPAGKPSRERLPELWRVRRVCSGATTFIAERSSEAFVRVDWRSISSSLFLCLGSSATPTLDAAVELSPPDASDLDGEGCNGSAWLELAEEN